MGSTCHNCGAPIARPASDRKVWTPLVVGLAAVLALLVIGVLDSTKVRKRLGIGRGTGVVSGGGEPVTAVPGNILPNFSLEQAGPGGPAGWRSSKWGSNAPEFAYLNVGHSGGKSVKVTMRGHVDGDAKWLHEPVAVMPGGDYRFTDWYQSDVQTEVILELHHNDGKINYEPLSAAPPSGKWRQYSANFSVPADVSRVTVFHIIAQDGYLALDDFVLAPHKAEGFARAVITLTFDDVKAESVSTILPRLDAYGFKSTQFFPTKFVEGSDDSVVRTIYGAGHEIGSHAVNHIDLRGLNDQQLDFELTHSKRYLESITGTSIATLATPFGFYDPRVLVKMKEHGYTSHRTVDEGYNSKDSLDPYKIRVRNVLLTTTPEDIRSWVERARRDRTWLVLVYHRVGTENLDKYDTKAADFEKHLEILKASGIPVVTLREALSEVTPQL